MKFELTSEQRSIVETIREVTQGEFKGRAQRYMDGSFPWENIRRLAELGVLGMPVPEEYGGSGMNVFDTALVLDGVAGGDDVALGAPDDARGPATAARLDADDAGGDALDDGGEGLGEGLEVGGHGGFLSRLKVKASKRRHIGGPGRERSYPFG